MTPEPSAPAVAAREPLFHGYLFSAAGVGARIDTKDAIEWLKAAEHPAGEFVWLHFRQVPNVVDGWPMRVVAPPDAFRDALREGSRSTRIARVQDGLIAVLNDVDYDLERSGPLEIATLWLHLDTRCLLSVRSQPLRSVDELRRDVDAGETFDSPMALLIRLLQEEADALFNVARTAAQTANVVEAALLRNQLPKRASLGCIRRDLVRLRRLLAPEPAALFRLAARPPRWVRDDDVQSLRQSAEDFSVALRDIGGLQERIALLEQEIADRVAEHTNRSVLILTAVTVVALPVNLIAGLFGMNIGGIPLRSSPHGFLVIVIVTSMLTAAGIWFMFRRRPQ